ncbi:H(+)/Cl(-) exchange transporter 7-like isoform X2 [Liolophura sinensis]|uniref:H(+)/Cl(-) exchange transporter 7-like isoform X2 n=1 Tax=Liolophura sinensis TaxID=3198878 RepID=UPI003158822B
MSAPAKDETEFIVTPVSADDQPASGKRGTLEKEIPVFEELNHDAENTDSYNQNSITYLLANRFRDFGKKIRQYSITSADEPLIRYRKRLISKYESQNYDICENHLYVQEMEKQRQNKIRRLWMARWLIMFLVGLGVALVAVAVAMMIEYAAHLKFSILQKYFTNCAKDNCMYIPVLMWAGVNLVISVLAAALVTYVEPAAAGSGIPLIKSYLNGVRIPGLMSLRALIAKGLGVVLSVMGGLACGKEGPMIHSGAIVAAGLAKGRSRICKKDFNMFDSFRNDREVRDFVSGGAAAGVAAAFGAPVGGVLFSLEEGASFWNQSLTWRVFFASMISTFSVNVFLSSIHGHPTALSSPGLVSFGQFPDIKYDLLEIPIFFLMAVIGGLSGALFVFLNYKLTVFRQRFLAKKWLKVAETGLVGAMSAVLPFVLIYSVNQCYHPPSGDHGHGGSEGHGTGNPSQVYCKEGEQNIMSMIFLRTPESSLIGMLHAQPEEYNAIVLSIFIPLYFLLAVWTYGLSVSSGVFVPSLLIGASWGRLIGLGIAKIFPFLEANLGKYALIGAACQLGGTVRMTISLTVILVECTGDITFGLPMMLVLMITKWVGDFFDTSLYDMNVHVAGIPLLPWDPPAMSDNLKANDVMNAPVAVFRPVERIGRIVNTLRTETFCGFPVTEAQSDAVESCGRLKGLILRSQLTILLKNKVYAKEGSSIPKNIKMEDFRNEYPWTVNIEDITISDEEKDFVMDLRPYMNPFPYTIFKEVSLPRVFRIFRGLGLRHLVVVSDTNEVLGMVTRKDLARYRTEPKRGMLKMEILDIQ